MFRVLVLERLEALARDVDLDGPLFEDLRLTPEARVGASA